jgi:hypothetical protein
MFRNPVIFALLSRNRRSTAASPVPPEPRRERGVEPVAICDQFPKVPRSAIAAILSAIRELTNPPASKRRGIGFTAHIDEKP